jgi:putative transposase
LVRIKSEEEIQQTLRVSETLRVLSPSRQFSNFFNAYAKAINKAYNRIGSLFQHPFGRVPVTQSEQLYRVVMYIHQNPQKHEFVDDFREWKYSSYGTLLSITPTRLQREQVMDWFNDCGEFESLHMDWISESESAGFAADDVD